MGMRLRSSDEMIRSRLPLAAILVAVVLAACGGRPAVTVAVAGQTVAMALASTTEGTRCSTTHGDGFVQNPPLTLIRAPTPVTLVIDAGQGATGIRGWLYDVDTPSPSGGPIEEFTLPGRSASYQARSIVPGRTYNVLVNVTWTSLVISGEVTHVFRVRIEPP